MFKQTEFMNSRQVILKYSMQNINKLLVLGAGNLEHETFLNPNIFIAIEIANDRLNNIGQRNDTVAIRYDFKNVIDLFPKNSFDAVILYDALEHLTKVDGIKLLSALEFIVKSQILIFVPLEKEYTLEYVVTRLTRT